MRVKKDPVEVEVKEYYRLVRTDRNLYTVETISISDGKVVKLEKEEPSYLPISFDKLRRKTAQEFFKAVNENI